MAEEVAPETPAAEAAPLQAEPAEPAAPSEPEPVAERPARRRSTIREAPPVFSANDDSAPVTAPAYVPPSPPAPVETGQPAEAEASDKPRRIGWWSKRA